MDNKDKRALNAYRNKIEEEHDKNILRIERAIEFSENSEIILFKDILESLKCKDTIIVFAIYKDLTALKSIKVYKSTDITDGRIGELLAEILTPQLSRIEIYDNNRNLIKILSV